MVISSRTPEGSPNLCPVCGSFIKIEPSDPAGDAPCPRCGHLLWFISEDLGETRVIKPTCLILLAEDLHRLIAHLPAKRGVHLVLDFREVQSLSSAVVGRLINLRKKLRGVSGKLKIENLHPDLLEVFRITRLDQVFDIDL